MMKCNYFYSARQKINNYVHNKRKRKIFTDLELLQTIYDLYVDDYNVASGIAVVLLPIDCHAIACKLEANVDLVFFRLYTTLSAKYNRPANNTNLVLFVPGEIKRIHFGYMTSILAELRAENKKYRLSLWIALVSLLLSIISIGIAFAQKE